MRILLLWPYNPQALHIPELFPLGLGYLAANLEATDHEAAIVDATLDRIPPDSDHFAALLGEIAPDVVGISFWSSNAEAVRASAATVREVLPAAKVVFGGPHATTHGVFEVEQGHADFALAGEAEQTLPQLLDALETLGGLETKGKTREPIAGLIRRDETGSVIQEAPVHLVGDLDILGRVDYHALRLAEYQARGYGYTGQAVLHPDTSSALIVATRGCPFQCRFCNAPVISGRKIRRHSPAWVAATVEDLYEKHGVRLVSLGDDNFTFRADYARSLCDAITALGHDDLIMAAPNGVRMNRMDRALLEAMGRAGFEEVTIAPESGSKRTLELMRKNMDLAKVEPFVDLCHEVGLKVKANFIIGFPGETIDDVLETEAFIKGSAFDQIGIAFFQPLPGTPIHDDLVATGEITDHFVPGRYSQLTYLPPGIDPEALCDAFNRTLNDFRRSRGWKFKNDRVGTIRLSGVAQE
jgi:anaerobic magnesium-protoporphyrin IX monomethyl ester cyclase